MFGVFSSLILPVYAFEFFLLFLCALLSRGALVDIIDNIEMLKLASNFTKKLNNFLMVMYHQFLFNTSASSLAYRGKGFGGCG